jgi:siroheme synthase
MSSETLDNVVENLVANNIGKDKLLAVIEQATTPFQQVHVSNMYDYKMDFKGRLYASPTLVIIGKVVALHGTFGWLENASIQGEYFKPVEDFQFENLIRESLVE